LAKRFFNVSQAGVAVEPKGSVMLGHSRSFNPPILVGFWHRTPTMVASSLVGAGKLHDPIV
jgi:hypothetical protein